MEMEQELNYQFISEIFENIQKAALSISEQPAQFYGLLEAIRTFYVSLFEETTGIESSC